MSKQKFAELTELSYGTVGNWNDDDRVIPGWVSSWLQNYIKSKSYEDIKDKVFEIENIKK